MMLIIFYRDNTSKTIKVSNEFQPEMIDKKSDGNRIHSNIRCLVEDTIINSLPTEYTLYSDTGKKVYEWKGNYTQPLGVNVRMKSRLERKALKSLKTMPKNRKTKWRTLVKL